MLKQLLVCSSKHGLMEVSRVSALIHRRCGATVLRSSLLLRPPSATLPAYGTTNRSASSDNAEASPIDLSDAMEALLEFDDSRHRSPLGQLRLSLSTMACAILISLRQSEIAPQRFRQARHRCLHCCLHGLGLMKVSCFSAPLHRCFCAVVF